MDIVTPKFWKRAGYISASLIILSISLQRVEAQASTTLNAGISAFLETAYTPLSNLKDICNFEIDANHQAVFCLDQINIKNISQPIVHNTCGNEITMNFQDEYIDLGCTANGLIGYFAPSQWEVAKIKGDGGVDVTGAPNKMLVEGANKAFISANPESKQQYFIVVPSEGFVVFDWKQVGGSNLLTNSFSLLINDTPVNLQEQNSEEGSYFSDYLMAGDLITLQIDNVSKKESQFSIENFTFHTNAIAVYKRTWEVEDSEGQQDQFDQYITIERASLAEVIFPADHDGVEAPAVIMGTSYDPSMTGFPVVDRDGDLSTTDDQYRLDAKDCAFEVTWFDESFTNNNENYISRQWMITDYCSGSNMEIAQVIKLIDAPKQIPAKFEAEKVSGEQNFNSMAKAVNPTTELPSGTEATDNLN